MALPEQLPSLPEPAPDSPWSYNIQSAVRVLEQIFGDGRRVALREDSDPLRIKHHLDRLSTEGLQILQGLEAEHQALPPDWLRSVAEQLGRLAGALRNMQRGIGGRYDITCCFTWCRALRVFSATRDASGVRIPQPVTTPRTGKRGRPRKVVSEAYLQEIFHSSRRIPATKVASVLHVHRNTIRNYMKSYSIQRKWSHITNAELDDVIRAVKQRHPKVGFHYIIGFLRAHSIRIQKAR